MSLTIIMYHYVRPIKKSKYPKINGLELDGFKRQLEFFKGNYNFVSAEETIEHFTTKRNLPENSIWLTFDDGYKDHFRYVLPELSKRKIQGTFFPPAEPILNNSLLDVNAIHFILAKTKDVSIQLDKLKKLCIKENISISNFEKLCEEVINTRRKTDRFDSKEELVFKRMLQKHLPLRIRNKLTKILFEDTLNININEFSKDLYMSCNELKSMVRENMFIGSHTFSHFFLDRLKKVEQKREIFKSLEFLKKIGMNTKDWIMCYPYGTYDDTTLEVLEFFGCKVGLTIKPGKIDLNNCKALELNRFDTNDFPQ